MFFFKPKTITVDAFTPYKDVFEKFKIDYAKNFYPSWWKNLGSSFIKEDSASKIKVDMFTIKKCVGFIDLYSKGFMIPLWTDVIFETTEGGVWRYHAKCENSEHLIHTHPAQQLGSEFSKTHFNLKFISPWMLKEKRGISFAFIEPTWNNFLLPYGIKTVPGVLNFKYQTATNINTLFPKKNQRIELDAGKPIAHIIPLTENKVKLKHHIVSFDEWIHLNPGSSAMIHSKYTRSKKIIDELENKQKKCPFGF